MSWLLKGLGNVIFFLSLIYMPLKWILFFFLPWVSEFGLDRAIQGTGAIIAEDFGATCFLILIGYSLRWMLFGLARIFA